MHYPGTGPSPDVSMLLGRVLERTEIITQEVREVRGTLTQEVREMRGTLTEIKQRLADGDNQLERHGTSIEDHKARLKKLEDAPKPGAAIPETIGAVEKLVKSWATWLIPLIALWLTGNLESAAKLAGVLK